MEVGAHMISLPLPGTVPMGGVFLEPRATVVHNAPPQALHERIARQQLARHRRRRVSHYAGCEFAMQPVKQGERIT